VILADSTKIAEAIIETLQSAKQNVMVQKFVAESKGKDVRAFVVGDRVVAAMRRVAQGQEFRSNVHRGGRTESVDLDDAYRYTAVRAAHIMGLQVAGVDMLEAADGPVVMEVNSSPGLEGIEAATGLDVAGTIMEHIEEAHRFPEVDLRERMNVGKGYAIAEFTVNEASDLAHKTLAETGLGTRGITVLNIRRSSIAIPSPAGATEVLPGDVMLCYGSRLGLKGLIDVEEPEPKTTKKKRKKK